MPLLTGIAVLVVVAPAVWYLGRRNRRRKQRSGPRHPPSSVLWASVLLALSAGALVGAHTCAVPGGPLSSAASATSRSR